MIRLATTSPVQRRDHPEAASLYPRYQAVGDELQAMVTAHPDQCERVSLGKSYEGRDIWALRVTDNVHADSSSKPAVVFTGGTHAREWATVTVPLSLAHNLVDGYGHDAASTDRLKKSEVWIVPCVNPDGYEYSLTQDPMWRKNRDPIPPQQLKEFPGGRAGVGVDLNRNYASGSVADYRSADDRPDNVSDDQGASDDPQDESYRGLGPASEPETQALTRLGARPNVKGWIDHHSYSQDVLYPENVQGNAAKPYQQVGALMEKAIQQAGGPDYQVIPTSDLYPTTGDSLVMMDEKGVPAMGFEIGDTFHPDQDERDLLNKAIPAADLVYLDWVLANQNPHAPAAA
ncbi:MAG TPA: M14 family zinc carboxypeptidase [Candidatus Xenobia bacterium]|jgi:murein tripeptide amidase MpaA